MKLRLIVFGATAAAALALPGIAQAYWGQTTGAVNMRTCASTRCAVITTLGYGSQVWINGNAGSWYQVNYGGRIGFVSASYVATQYAAAPNRPRVTLGFNFGNRPPAPAFGYYRQPTWDDRSHAWYDGRRWYSDGRWYNAPPNGISFGFSFGG